MLGPTNPLSLSGASVVQVDWASSVPISHLYLLGAIMVFPLSLFCTIDPFDTLRKVVGLFSERRLNASNTIQRDSKGTKYPEIRLAKSLQNLSYQDILFFFLRYTSLLKH